jgi:hypothetical protein
MCLAREKAKMLLVRGNRNNLKTYCLSLNLLQETGIASGNKYQSLWALNDYCLVDISQLTGYKRAHPPGPRTKNSTETLSFLTEGG